MICINCQRDTADKAIYAGLPVRMCFADDCNTLWGFWSELMLYLPFNGWFYRYEGSYLVALYHWLRYADCEEEE